MIHPPIDSELLSHLNTAFGADGNRATEFLLTASQLLSCVERSPDDAPPRGRFSTVSRPSTSSCAGNRSTNNRFGWEPDINDSVRLIICPFMPDYLPGGKKGTGILWAQPDIHWRKDRGKEPFRDQERFPWFWNDREFTGDRVNDVHLTAGKKSSSRPHELVHEPPIPAGTRADMSSRSQV